MKKTGELKDAIKKANAAPNAVKWIQDHFAVTYSTAKRFVDEMQTGGEFKNDTKSAKPVSEQIQDLKVDQFMDSLEDCLTGPTELVSIREKLFDKKFLKPYGLKLIFERVVGKTASIKNRDVLIDGICYGLQLKYYNKLYNCDVPESVRNKAEQAIGVCV